MRRTCFALNENAKMRAVFVTYIHTCVVHARNAQPKHAFGNFVFICNAFYTMAGKVHVGCLQRSFSQRSIDRDGERLAQSLSSNCVILFCDIRTEIHWGVVLSCVLSTIDPCNLSTPNHDLEIRQSFAVF